MAPGPEELSRTARRLMRDPSATGLKMLAIAHRGRRDPSAGASENTLAAFATAIALGADGIETDVRLSRDGRLVLFHDRLAPDGREVASLSAAELAAAAGYPVPTLDEALARFPDLFWNVEIKVPAAVPATLERIDRFLRDPGGARRPERLLISSFWHPLVEPFTRFPGVECGLLLASRPASFDAFAGLFPRDGSIRTAVWAYEVLDPALLDQGRALGFRNYVYGVETEEEHRHCAELPLAGVITDHLERLGR
jgi:glycerophosphoryl diester phosphodiesterase